MSFKTASWRIREETSRNDYAPIVSNRVIRWSGDSLFYRDEGDDDGMLRYVNARTGEVPFGIASAFCEEERVLDSKTGSLWARSINSPFTTLTSKDVWLDYVDYRTLGLRSTVIQRTDPKGMIDLLRAGDGLTFRAPVDRGGGLKLISATGSANYDGTIYEYEWEIDEGKGPSVVAARQYLRNPEGPRSLNTESRCFLAKSDGIWWPVRVEFESPSLGERRIFDFQHVEFDAPTHSTQIDADTLGLPVGAVVYIQGQRRRDRYLGAGALIDETTWKSVRDEYGRAPYREFSNRALAHGRGQFPAWWSVTDGTEGIQDLADRPDQWELFVRRWVLRRTNNGQWRVSETLTDIQRTTAQGILDECRKTATPIRMRLDKEAAKVATELAEAEGMLAARNAKDGKGVDGTAGGGSEATYAKVVAPTKSTKDSQPAPDDALTKRIADLKARKAELAKSPEIERIFDQLKSRLEGLLTAKQKDPANGGLKHGKAPPIPGMKGAVPTPSPSHAPTPRPAPAAKP